MDLSNLGERDKRTVERFQERKADIAIIQGLVDKGYSNSEIAEMMGAPEAQIAVYIRRGYVTRKEST